MNIDGGNHLCFAARVLYSLNPDPDSQAPGCYPDCTTLAVDDFSEVLGLAIPNNTSNSTFVLGDSDHVSVFNLSGQTFTFESILVSP